MIWNAGSGVPDPKHESYISGTGNNVEYTEPAALTSGNIIRLLLPSTRSISTDVIIVSKSEIRNKIHNFLKNLSIPVPIQHFNFLVIAQHYRM
jgi:hypothetical protein